MSRQEKIKHIVDGEYMRIQFPEELKKKMAKVDPYLVERKDEAGVDFIEDTPQYIKELHEECRREIDDLLNI